MKTAPAGYASATMAQRLRDDPDPAYRPEVLVDFKTAIRSADHRAHLQPDNYAAVGRWEWRRRAIFQPLAVWRANERQHAAF